MPKHISKFLKKCLSKLKKYPSKIQLLIQSSYSFSNSKNFILSGCKQPRVLSFAIDRNQKDDDNSHDDNNDNNNISSATLLDIDRFLYENFRSSYITDEEDDKKEGEDCDGDKIAKGVLFDSPRFIEPPTNFCGSHPFFVASGFAGSLIKETQDSFTANFEDMVTLSSTSTSSANGSPNHDSSIVFTNFNHVKLLGDSIVVLRHSPSPYGDFRRSMQEMVEARLQDLTTIDWDFLEKILFCYMGLNDKKSYKFILRAFVDLVVGLRQN